VALTVSFTNSGNLAAVDFAATVTATGATVLTPLISIPSIAPFGGVESFDVRVVVDDSIVCGTPVAIDVDLVDMQTRWGPLPVPTEELAACDFSTPGPGDPCVVCASCIAPDIVPIDPVYAVISGARADVTLDWSSTTDPNAESYSTWVVADAANKTGIPAARESGPWPSVIGCRQRTGKTCVDLGAVAGTGGDINFYQVRGVCGTVEGPE